MVVYELPLIWYTWKESKAWSKTQCYGFCLFTFNLFLIIDEELLNISAFDETLLTYKSKNDFSLNFLFDLFLVLFFFFVPLPLLPFLHNLRRRRRCHRCLLLFFSFFIFFFPPALLIPYFQLEITISYCNCKFQKHHHAFNWEGNTKLVNNKRIEISLDSAVLLCFGRHIGSETRVMEPTKPIKYVVSNAVKCFDFTIIMNPLSQKWHTFNLLLLSVNLRTFSK